MSPWGLTAWCLLLSSSAQDTGIDADGDGVTVEGGDCDDTDERVAAGLPEVCGDELDNDCDGLLDENCDNRAQMASLRGGGGCDDSLAVILLWPGLLLWRRRQRR